VKCAAQKLFIGCQFGVSSLSDLSPDQTWAEQMQTKLNNLTEFPRPLNEFDLEPLVCCSYLSGCLETILTQTHAALLQKSPAADRVELSPLEAWLGALFFPALLAALLEAAMLEPAVDAPMSSSLTSKVLLAAIARLEALCRELLPLLLLGPRLADATLPEALSANSLPVESRSESRDSSRPESSEPFLDTSSVDLRR